MFWSFLLYTPPDPNATRTKTLKDFIQVTWKDVFKIFTKMWGVYSLLWDTVYIYIEKQTTLINLIYNKCIQIMSIITLYYCRNTLFSHDVRIRAFGQWWFFSISLFSNWVEIMKLESLSWISSKWPFQWINSKVCFGKLISLSLKMLTEVPAVFV